MGLRRGIGCNLNPYNHDPPLSQTFTSNVEPDKLAIAAETSRRKRGLNRDADPVLYRCSKGNHSTPSRSHAMSSARLIALPCKISRGIVPDERAFEVSLAGEKTHTGVAPVHYFWDQHGNAITSDSSLGDQEIEGKIAARLLDRNNGDALVSIPDGAVVKVPSKHITARPSEIKIDVSVGPRS